MEAPKEMEKLLHAANRGSSCRSMGLIFCPNRDTSLPASGIKPVQVRIKLKGRMTEQSCLHAQLPISESIVPVTAIFWMSCWFGVWLLDTRWLCSLPMQQMNGYFR